MIWRLVAAVAWCAIAPRALPAQAGSSHDASPLTLQDAIASALRNNLDLRIASSMVDSARAETHIARALPNPTLSAVPNSPFQYSATLSLDVGPQRTSRVRVSDLGARAAEWDVRESRRQVILAVDRAFLDVLLADARRQIVSSRRDVMLQMVAADSARVRAGDLPERALIRSQIELNRTETDRARAVIDAQAARLVLQGLMGKPVADTVLRIEGTLGFRPVTFDTVDVGTLTLANRPDVEASRARESQSVAAQQAARALVVPIPQLSYVRQFNGPFDSGHYFALGVAFELPVLNQYRAQQERANASHDAATYVRRRVESQAAREVQAALAEFRTQEVLIRRYESGVIDRMQQSVDATRYAYTRGAASLLDVLDALRTQQDLLIEYQTALHDYWVAAYTVEATTGVPVR